MPRWVMLSLMGALAFTLALGLPLKTALQPEVPVSVSVTVDGEPADAMVLVLRGEALVAVEYTDVHTPGQARFGLTPGAYTLQVEHGAGFVARPQRRALSVHAGQSVEVEVAIARVFNPQARGYYGVDLHVHTGVSAESTLRIFGIPNHGNTPVDQAVGVQLAAGLDVAFISDHNSVAGHEPFAQTATERGVPFLLSEEITTVLWGHFNPISLELGRLVEFGFAKTPSQFFAESRQAGATVIQVNHPYSPGFGYFFLEKQPQFDDTFDAVEAFNGDFGDDDLQAVLRLFSFWNAGRHVVATAVSDDHFWKELGTRYGTPRTYLAVGGPLSTAAALDALTAGRATLSYGPLIDLRAGDVGPGGTLTLKPGALPPIFAEIEGVDGLDGLTAELLYNGAVVASVSLSGTSQRVEFSSAELGPGWVAVRVTSSPRRYRALTNPVWLVPAGG